MKTVEIPDARKRSSKFVPIRSTFLDRQEEHLHGIVPKQRVLYRFLVVRL